MQTYCRHHLVTKGLDIRERCGIQMIGWLLLSIFVGCILVTFSFAENSRPSMKGPRTDVRPIFSKPEIPTSCMQIAFQDAIQFYQHWISPIGGSRCGFRPSCSRYGYTAVSTQGPVVGLMMTGDRLIRCNIWKSPGPDYFLLPNGRLFDPVLKNLLGDP